MAAPTEAQLRNLEIAHKQHMISLIQSALFRIGVAERYGIGSPQFISYNYNYVKSLTKWVDREMRLMKKSGKGTLPEWIYKERPGKFGTLFFDRAGVTILQKLAQEIDKEGKGIGFIPLIIWGIIAIAGFFTASEIIDETNNTSQEQAILISSTQDFCKQNNLSKEECEKLLQTQTEATKGQGGFFDSLTKIALWGAAAFVTVKFVIPAFTDKKKAA